MKKVLAVLGFLLIMFLLGAEYSGNVFNYLESTGDITAAGDISATGSVVDGISDVRLMQKEAADAPAQPYACDATHEAEWLYVDDTNDNGYAKVCFCAYDDNPGAYAWIEVDGLGACF